MTHSQRIIGYLMEHPQMSAAVNALGAEFGPDMELHLCDHRDMPPMRLGEIVARNADGEPIAVIHTNGQIWRLDNDD